MSDFTIIKQEQNDTSKKSRKNSSEKIKHTSKNWEGNRI